MERGDVLNWSGVETLVTSFLTSLLFISKTITDHPSPISKNIEAGQMRIIAVLASYNEEMFIEACLSHYEKYGIEVYLLDNESTDNTIRIAEKFLSRSLIFN